MSLAVTLAGAFRKTSIISRPARKGWPCLVLNSGTTSQISEEAVSNAARNIPSVEAVAGGRSTSVIMAASRPRFRTSRNPTRRELNCPSSGAGLRTRDPPAAYTAGARVSSLFPATTTTRSVKGLRARMVAETNVSPENGMPDATGGHGSRALSEPMRVDSPAASITPHQLGARLMRADSCGEDSRSAARLALLQLQLLRRAVGNRGESYS